MNKKIITQASPFEETLNKHFPGALIVPKLVNTVTEKVNELGFAPVLVKPAIATCRDDSIYELTEQLREEGYSSPFRMERLAGVPLFGVTAVRAFYHHIPDKGIGLLVYGPHIGIDSEGKIGYLDRHGIEHPGKSCGANHALLGLWDQKKFGPYDNDEEMSGLSLFMSSERKAVMEAENPLLALTNLEYEKGLRKLKELVTMVQQSEHHKYPIIVCAGINVDSKHDDNNRFQIRDLLVLNDGVATQYFNYRS